MRTSRIILAALALPLLAGCSSLLDNQSIGPAGVPAGGAMFTRYIALGTSISAGVQSAGIDDSTQQRAYPYLLAGAMGLTPGANWFYPAFNAPGCPPPYTNPLTGARVGGFNDATGGGSLCGLVNPLKAPLQQNYYNNLGVPSMRVGQALHIAALLDPSTDTLGAAMFITGGRSPVAIVAGAQPTFVTVELGANDALHAATSGDTTLLTPLALFTAQYDSLATDIAAVPGVKVALANVPNVDNIPFLTKGQVFFCLATGACPGVPATAPFNSPNFVVDVSCAPSAAGGVGDKMAVGFPATAKIAGVLAGGGGATLNCGAGTASVITGPTPTPVGPVVGVAAMAAISARVAAFNGVIAGAASSHGWAYANLDSAMAALVVAGAIPAFPNLTGTGPIFGNYISLDGFHPSNAAHKLIADLFVAAIDHTYGKTLTPP